MGITQLSFRFKFSSSCLYPIVDKDDYAVNKLYGFSYGCHHANSIRIGWRPSLSDDRKIEIFSYIYNNKQRSFESLASIHLERWYIMKISVLKEYGKVCFKLKTEKSEGVEYLITSQSYQHFVMPKFRLGYMLRPFFGGEKVAPHDMQFEIERTK